MRQNRLNKKVFGIILSVFVALFLFSFLETLAEEQKAGEKLRKDVVSSGGRKGTSSSYIQTGTFTQTSVGKGTSASNKLGAGFWYGLAEGEPPGMCGDVNSDELVNLGDPICLANYYFGKPCEINPWASDVNCEAGANLGDAIIIANVYFGKPGFELNCCP